MLKRLQAQASEEAPPKKEDSYELPVHDESNWLVSYADMMTLLCIFFVLLFSMSKINEPQYEKVKESVIKQFGGDYKSPTKELAKFVTQVLQEAGVEKEVVITSDPFGAAVAFHSAVFFETLSAEVTPQGQDVLKKLIAAMAERQGVENKKYRIVVEGHTDSRPVLGGTFASNWELSAARAARVVRLFLEKNFEPNQLTAIGYADTYPELPSRNPAGEWDEKALSKNRRVIIRILEPKNDAIPYPETAKSLTHEAPPVSSATESAARP